MTIDAEQREYFRIDDSLPVEFRVVSLEEFQRLENSIRYSPTYKADRSYEMRFLGEIMSHIKEEENEVARCLKVIEKKLDIMIDLMNVRSDDRLYKSLYTPVNISGAGIKFTSDTPLTAGERVELRLALPLAPYFKISTLCEVVRVEGVSEAVPEAWQIAMKFLAVNEFDRDLLINHVFSREREKLRLTRENG